MGIILFNSSVLTTFGVYRYERISFEECKKLISNGFTSAVGHEETCKLLTSLLGLEVKYNRNNYKQEVGDIGIVFKLKKRIKEGQILTKSELGEIGYEFGKLERLE